MDLAREKIRQSKPRYLTGVIVPVLLLPHCAAATEATPYSARRVSPMHSEWYAVISGASGEDANDPIFGPVKVRIIKQQTGTAHARPGIVFRDGFRHSYSRDVSVRPGDIVVAQFQMEAPPNRLLVSATGHGVVAFGVRPPDPHVMPVDFVEKNYLLVAPADASVVHRRPAQCVMERARAHRHRIAGTFGAGADWVDEPKARVLFACEIRKNGRKDAEWIIESISFKDATVTPATGTDVLDSMSQPNAASLPIIVQTAMAMKLHGDPARLQSLFREENLSKSERVAVAAFLAHCGTNDGVEAVYVTAKSAADQLRADSKSEARVWEAVTLGHDIGFDDRSDELLAAKLAVEYLPECVGAKAMPLLKDIVAHSARGGTMNEIASEGLKKLEARLQR